jgi:hypothetical protein
MENVLHVEDADIQRQIDRLLGKMKQMQRQNELDAKRIERARTRTAHNLQLAEKQLDALAKL